MTATREEKNYARRIVRHLEKGYPDAQCALHYDSPFQLLIATILSAQCTDERVNKVTPLLFDMASSPEAMSKISQQKIYEIIKPCGLGPKKSSAILELSNILVEKFSGKVPQDINELEKLPGVGHKTASVVISQGFGIPAFPVDTHIHRLAQRWGLTKGKNVVQTEKDLKKLFPKSDWNKLHLQIIFWGREFCQARECFGIKCEICSSCFPKRTKPFAHKRP